MKVFPPFNMLTCRSSWKSSNLLDEADVLRLSRQVWDLCARIGCNRSESNPSTRERAFLLPVEGSSENTRWVYRLEEKPAEELTVQTKKKEI